MSATTHKLSPDFRDRYSNPETAKGIHLADAIMDLCDGQEARDILPALVNITALVVAQISPEYREGALEFCAQILEMVAGNIKKGAA
jgi:hypothetical protein